jgi:osmotically-inducible protein OsmY
MENRMFNKKNKSILILIVILSSSLLISCTSVHKQESAGQFVDGSVITTKVKTKLLTDKVVSGLPITVTTYKKTVQLSGFVNNLQQKRRAEQIAYSVEGVQAVEDSLIIKTR